MQVRDAMVECFFEAHCMDSGIDMDEKKEGGVNKGYCESIVKKAFDESGGDYLYTHTTGAILYVWAFGYLQLV